MTPAHAPADHPRIKPAKTGILIANLGTPDGYDYWSMRRYLNEFLSDKRVVDLPSWKWQPLLQGVILATRPRRSGANYRRIWRAAENESPLRTFTRAQAERPHRFEANQELEFPAPKPPATKRACPPLAAKPPPARRPLHRARLQAPSLPVTG